MSKLWVKFKQNNPTQVSTKGCEDVDDFIKSCKKELSQKLGSYDTDELSLSTSKVGTPLRPSLSLKDFTSWPGYIKNDDEYPLFISVSVEKQDPTRQLIEPPQGKYSFLS